MNSINSFTITIWFYIFSPKLLIILPQQLIKTKNKSHITHRMQESHETQGRLKWMVWTFSLTTRCASSIWKYSCINVYICLYEYLPLMVSVFNNIIVFNSLHSFIHFLNHNLHYINVTHEQFIIVYPRIPH